MTSINSNINTDNYDKYTKNDLISIINSMKKKEIFTMMNNYNTQNGKIIDKVIEKNNFNIKKEKITIQKKNLNKLYLQQAMDNNKIYNNV
jgi:hypothetical protein